MITVEHEGLTSAATGLAGSAAVPGAPSCVPPAADPVSGGVAGMFNAHSAGVSALLGHAAALRSVGGASLSGDAAAGLGCEAGCRPFRGGDHDPAADNTQR